MHKSVLAVARGMAVLGGLVLSALIVITCVSVIGGLLNKLAHGALDWLAPGLARWMLEAGVGPVFGDTEMVEVGVAFVIFCFLPICQITGGHASVDIFTSKLPDRVNRLIQLVVDLVFAVVLIVIAWRLFEGMQEKLRYNETTYDLQFPIWWSYAASLSAACVAALVGVYVAGARMVEGLSGRVILPRHEGPDG